jgi:CheY-like chemotaxis protein
VTKILVIDDDDMVRITMVRLLEDLGYDVVCAEDGERGLGIFRNDQPDLVITDLTMPEREGIATIIEIRRDRPAVKVIAISGGGRIQDSDFLDMAKKLGADDVIAKPFDPDEFADRVGRCLHGGHLRAKKTRRQ